MFVRRHNADANPMPGQSKPGQLVEVLAPAKINLFLEVLGKRDDGYHDLDMVMASVRLFDTLTFNRRDDHSFHLSCQWESTGGMNWNQEPLVNQETNLVYRAALALSEYIDDPTLTGANISLLKRIPTRAGLGGGSSDAAATLIGLCHLWDLQLEKKILLDIAANLGSDVPFFIEGGFARCQSRGEEIDVLKRGCLLHLVIAQSDEGLSTPEVFSQCTVPSHPEAINGILSAVTTGNPTEVAGCLHNRLSEPAAYLAPSIRGIEKTMMEAGCLASAMSGSGSAVFGICRNSDQARQIAGLLRARQLGWVRATSTILKTNHLPLLAS